MPARDYNHEHVRRALEKDGWTITHDPLRLRVGVRDLYVGLGAELVGAEKDSVAGEAGDGRMANRRSASDLRER